MARTYFPPEKRLDRVSRSLREDLIFDLVNAFGLLKDSKEASQLLVDILTEKEINNIAKRLRIAKYLLGDYTHEEIVDELHCGFGTVARVQSWLESGGDGLRKTIARLPKRKQPAKIKEHFLPAYLRTPELLLEYAQHLQAKGEKTNLQKIISQVNEKAVYDRALKEDLDNFYRNKNFSRNKNKKG